MLTRATTSRCARFQMERCEVPHEADRDFSGCSQPPRKRRRCGVCLNPAPEVVDDTGLERVTPSQVAVSWRLWKAGCVAPVLSLCLAAPVAARGRSRMGWRPKSSETTRPPSGCGVRRPSRVLRSQTPRPLPRGRHRGSGAPGQARGHPTVEGPRPTRSTLKRSGKSPLRARRRGASRRSASIAARPSRINEARA
jgi:hypothetical protein